ncbi:MAG: MORN repeat-containing protein [Anderseniella sp.]
MSLQLRAILGLGVMLGLAGHAQAEDVWISTSNQECQVASDEALKENESVTWSGACRDGRATGSGRLEWFVDGKFSGDYDGEMSDGRFHGKGLMRFQVEKGKGFDRLEGTFAMGEPEGEARFDAANGDFYTGGFHKGERHGMGYYRLVTGEQYYGDFENGQRHGMGFLIDNDGNAFLGQFENGEAKGAGVVENSDGSKFQGEFAKSLPSGAGTYVAPNGDTYQGQFTAGKANGKVLVTKADGSQALEDWKDGEKVK